MGAEERKSQNRRNRRRAICAAAAIACAALLAQVVPAGAHIERASYWPNPGPDTSVNPPAGGAVPQVRSVFTALDPGQPGTTRVVCQDRYPTPPNTSRLKKRLKRA